MRYAFTDYDTVRPHSSIDFIPPEEFEKGWIENENSRNEFPDERKR